MNDDLAGFLETLGSIGYDSVTPAPDRRWPEASGSVALPKKYRSEANSGWGRLLPVVYCGGDPALVPPDLRTVVEDAGWTVQPVGRDGETVLVVISENSV